MTLSRVSRVRRGVCGEEEDDGDSEDQLAAWIHMPPS